MASGAPASSWRQLLVKAKECNSYLKHSSFLQLATIGSNGRPSNRTLVFRGFQDGSDRIQINTDTRSKKIEELKQCPFAEICWYFTDSWEQFRISGKVDVIDGSNADPSRLQQREKAWFDSSIKSRQQYLGPHPDLPLSEESNQELTLDPSAGPLGTYCLLVLDPDQVDYYNLRSSQRIRFSSTVNTDGTRVWTSQRINP